MAQQDKDPVLTVAVQDQSPVCPIQCYGFNPWPRGFHMPQVQPKKRRTKKRERKVVWEYILEIDVGDGCKTM